MTTAKEAGEVIEDIEVTTDRLVQRDQVGDPAVPRDRQGRLAQPAQQDRQDQLAPAPRDRRGLPVRLDQAGDPAALPARQGQPAQQDRPDRLVPQVQAQQDRPDRLVPQVQAPRDRPDRLVPQVQVPPDQQVPPETHKSSAIRVRSAMPLRS
jgi:hypothetical protein